MTTSTMPRHSERAPRKNLRRAGALKKRRPTPTVVPRRRAVSVTSATEPPAARTTVPAPSPSAVSISSCETEQIAGNASPRKPKLRTPTKSPAERILDVACRASASTASSRDMPEPSSLTRISWRPPSSTAMSMEVAPASSAFSTSSFTTDAGRSTTSPAAIWSATALGRIAMTEVIECGVC